MPPPADTDEPLRFEHFERHPAERVLRVRGEAVPMGSRAFDLLLALAQRHERFVTKLCMTRRRCWPRHFRPMAPSAASSRS